MSTQMDKHFEHVELISHRIMDALIEQKVPPAVAFDSFLNCLEAYAHAMGIDKLVLEMLPSKTGKKQDAEDNIPPQMRHRFQRSDHLDEEWI